MSLCPLQLGQEGKVPLRSAHLYYNVTEKVRRMMESYFRLEVPLHFSYSHLVCRTAIDGERSPGEHNPGDQVSFSLLSCLWPLHQIRAWAFPWRPPCCSITCSSPAGGVGARP